MKTGDGEFDTSAIENAALELFLPVLESATILAAHYCKPASAFTPYQACRIWPARATVQPEMPLFSCFNGGAVTACRSLHPPTIPIIWPIAFQNYGLATAVQKLDDRCGKPLRLPLTSAFIPTQPLWARFMILGIYPCCTR